MRIGIIGAGISGLVSAYLLHDEHDITVLEVNDYIGGHTHTVDVEENDDRSLPVDTGFIVYNERNYPNFSRLLARLGVATQRSDMSFSVQSERDGNEYAGDSLNTLFARRSNLLRPAHYRMLVDVARFNRHAARLAEHLDPDVTLGDFLATGGYSRSFVEKLIVPMGAAIWSNRPIELYSFPALNFIRFFQNHGVLHLRNKPQWRVISGGSHRYVEALTRRFADRIHLSTPVASVRRQPHTVEVRLREGDTLSFDRLIIATHSDQALRMLADPSRAELEVLGSIPYQLNRVVLHTGTELLPRRRSLRASWNYLLPAEPRDRVAVTYYMNRLQSLASDRDYCVTLNRQDEIRSDTVLQEFDYAHPVYTAAAFRSQQRADELNGINRTYYCGAYWGNGFHEDGVNSALEVCRHFGKGLH